MTRLASRDKVRQRRQSVGKKEVVRGQSDISSRSNHRQSKSIRKDKRVRGKR